MCHFPYFVCPIQYSETLEKMTMECEPDALFQPQEYELPGFLSGFCNLVSIILFTT